MIELVDCEQNSEELQAIGQCEAEQPVDPVPFFLRCCEQQSVRRTDLSPGSKMLIGG